MELTRARVYGVTCVVSGCKKNVEVSQAIFGKEQIVPSGQGAYWTELLTCVILRRLMLMSESGKKEESVHNSFIFHSPDRSYQLNGEQYYIVCQLLMSHNKIRRARVIELFRPIFIEPKVR